jgi:hypothetical protein
VCSSDLLVWNYPVDIADPVACRDYLYQNYHTKFNAKNLFNYIEQHPFNPMTGPQSMECNNDVFFEKASFICIGILFIIFAIFEILLAFPVTAQFVTFVSGDIFRGICYILLGVPTLAVAGMLGISGGFLIIISGTVLIIYGILTKATSKE